MMWIPTSSPVCNATDLSRSGVWSFSTLPDAAEGGNGTSLHRTFAMRSTMPPAGPALVSEAQHDLHDTTEPNPDAVRNWEMKAAWGYWLAKSGKRQQLTMNRRPLLRRILSDLGLECFLYATDVVTDEQGWWVKKNRVTVDFLLDLEKCDTWACRSPDFNDGVVHTWPDRYAKKDPKPQ